MEPSENLPEMEPVEVPEDPRIMLAQNINSAMRQDRRVKAKAAKEAKLKRRFAVGGPAGSDGRGSHGGPCGLGECRKTGGHTTQPVPWSKP
ncbi:Secologanin synthase [Hordeum vulgare]|nr:Secologanin synthase [Hordeum vulgare]